MRLMNFIGGFGVVMTTLFLLMAASGVFALRTVAPVAAGAGVFRPIRINAGATEPYTDPDGNVWLSDTGFTGGEILDRGPISVANTKLQGVYRTEHYSMDSFTQAMPNGNYTVKLHFAETYEGISGKGERVFSFK